MSNASGTGSARTPNQMMLRRTLFLMIACGIVAFVVLAGRLFKLQIIDHDLYEQRAVEQQLRETKLSAERGTIYDRNMKILSMSASVETVYISPREIDMYDEDPVFIAEKLSEILGVDKGKIIEMTADKKSWYKTVAVKIEPELAEQVRAFKNEYKLVGVKLEPDTKRYYPYSSLASHIIGFVGSENKGMSGIEAYYDSVLSGISGRVVRAKNAAGTDMLFTKFEDYYDAEDGNDVVLTLDSTIQYYLEKHLEQAVLDYDVQNGAAAIAMDVNTGALLGMVSLGNFDLNDYQTVSDEVQAQIDAAQTPEEKSSILSAAQQLQWRNKALMDTYEPGSTFKIITLAMALEENLTKESDPFYCSGHVDNVPGRTKPVNCWRTQGHGAQNLIQAVQHSCNVAFVNLGLRVGTEKFYEYAEAFGFFNSSPNPDAQLTGKTGIDLGGESGSIWWPRSTFISETNLSQLAAASFGQTLTITPLQLITAVSACANGGYLMKPYVVDEIRDADGNVVKKNEPVTVRQVISETTSNTITRILESVVGDKNEGTGRNAYVAGYSIGGKTGTSTDTVKEAATGIKEYKVSFIGIAPCDDPQIAILVILDNPSNATGIYISGGQMAAPTVGKMMADILPYLGVETNFTEEEKQVIDKSVPGLKNMTVDEAKSLLAQDGLTCRVMGSGDIVTAQLPLPAAVVAAGSEIILYAGEEPSGGTTTVPSLWRLSYAQARATLNYQGLYVRAASGLFTGSGSVVISNQSIAPGEQVPYGTVIEVTLVDVSDVGLY